MCLPKRRYVLREDVAFPEIGKRYSCGLIRGHATRNQLPPAIIKMLRELFDDFGFAGGREVQAR